MLQTDRLSDSSLLSEELQNEIKTEVFADDAVMFILNVGVVNQ